MLKSSLVEIFKTFSKADLKEFGLFVNSSFFNTNQSVIKLFDQLRKLYPEFEEKQLDKKILFEKSFGGIKYNDSFMRMTIFRLQEMVKVYLTYLNINKNPGRKHLNYLNELKDRNLIKQLNQSINTFQKTIDKTRFKDIEYFLVSFEVIELKSYVYINQDKKLNLQKFIEEYTSGAEKFTALLVNGLVYATNLYFLNEKFITTTSSGLYFVNEVMEFAEKHPFVLEYPIINLWYNLSMLLTKFNDVYFFRTKEIIIRESENLRPLQLFNALVSLSTYCQSKIQMGTSSFLREKFDIINLLIKQGLYTVYPGNEKLDYNGFNDAVTISLMLNEFDWCETFIEKYKDKLDEDTREQAIHKSKVKLFFYKREFEKALSELVKFNYYSVWDKAFVRIYSMRIYYELELADQAFSQIDSARHFLKNDKELIDVFKNNFRNFLKNYKLLLDKKFLLKEIDLTEMKSNIVNAKMDYGMTKWFMNKIEDLEENVSSKF